MSQFDTIIKQIEDNKVEIVHFNFIDPTGVLRSKSVLSREILRTLHISLEDGISVNGNLLPGYRDENRWFRVVPELDTFCVLPAGPSIVCREAAMLCSISNTAFDSRKILQDLMTRAKAMGLFPMSGMGFAYGLEDTSAAEGNGIYQLLPGSRISNFNSQLIQGLLSAGIDVESFMAYGPAHNGIEMVPQGVDKSADQIAMCGWIARSLGLQHGRQVNASYPFENACPVHMSVWSEAHDRNLFFNPDGKMEYSDLAWQFVAGILANFDEIFAVIQATSGRTPTEPVKKAFSNTDTQCVLGTPEFFVEQNKKARVGWSKRCVFRGIPAEANLYLALAAVYLSGLDGITNSRKPEDYSEQEYDAASSNVAQKRRKLEESQLFRDFFGDNVMAILDDWLKKQEG